MLKRTLNTLIIDSAFNTPLGFNYTAQDVYKRQAEALKKPSLKVATIAELGGNNSVKTADVLWGMQIIADQSSGLASFFSHMDADAPGMYASKARQCISTCLLYTSRCV